MANLQNLPEDVKRLICAEIGTAQTIRPLSQVSKAWRAVAESSVYRGLELAVSSKEGLQADLRLLAEHDVASKYLKHARYLYITSSAVASPYQVDEKKKSVSGLAPLASTFSILEPMAPPIDEVFISDMVEDREAAQETWRPLANTIPLFNHLTDIVIKIKSRFPPGLLPAIELHHPKCRLHLRHFRYKSLRESITDRDERALAMSPLLHSLSIMYTHRDSNGVDDHNGAAALRTVALAPNLKHVRMLGCRPASSYALHSARGRPLEVWKGFEPPIEESTSQKAKLETLSFVCYNDTLDFAKLDKWERIADLSRLKALSCSIRDEEFLRHIAQYGKFPSLAELKLSLEPNKENFEGFQQAVEQFFATLNPLHSLALSGALHGGLLDIIARHHGPTLKNLSLKPFRDGYGTPGPVQDRDLSQPDLRITASALELLASGCPGLTSVDLTLRRSMGDVTETRCYEALGTFHRLTRLRLSLDCSNADAWELHPEDDWDDFDKATQTPSGQDPKHYNGHLKRAMVNSALDDQLARQIWDVINENRTRGGLESLAIHTYGGSGFANCHPGDLMNICNHVSRSYVLTTSEDVEGGVEVVESSKTRREERDQREREHEHVMLEKWGHKGLSGSSWVVFRHIWPFDNDEDWREKWKSWPLQRGVEKATP